jgi:hypothetical protein
MSSLRLRLYRQRRGELLIKGEKIFNAMAVAGERFSPVTAVHGAVQFGMRLDQFGRHGHGIVKIDQQLAAPEEIDKTVLALEIADGLLEGGDRAALDAENVEKLIAKGFRLSAFAGFSGSLPGEFDGAIPDFVP